jgi:hypothetical protein
VDSSGLTGGLAPAVDATLADQLVSEMADMEQAFALRRWKYSELDGGRFCEVAARILYADDSNNVSLSKSVDDCLRYLENDQASHASASRQQCLHLARVIRAMYKLRSQRGAVHVSPTYTANEFDAHLIMSGCRWIFGELIRTYSSAPLDVIARAIEELSRVPHPLMRVFGIVPVLQATDYTTEEEILAHLLHERSGLSTRDLVARVARDPSTVRRNIKHLASSAIRQIVDVTGSWHVSDIGIARIEGRMTGR